MKILKLVVCDLVSQGSSQETLMLGSRWNSIRWEQKGRGEKHHGCSFSISSQIWVLQPFISTKGTNETCEEFLPMGKSALWGSLRRESTGKSDTGLWFPLLLTSHQRNRGQMGKWRNLWATSETTVWEAELVNHPRLFMPLSLLEPGPPGICYWNKLLRILILSQIKVVPAVPILEHSCKWETKFLSFGSYEQ